MQKSGTPQRTSAPLGKRILALAQATAQEFNAISSDRALAGRATEIATLPRQRLAELRALYTMHAAPGNTRIDMTAPRSGTCLRQRVFKLTASQEEA